MFDRVFLPRWLWLFAVGIWLVSAIIDPKYLAVALVVIAASLGQPLVSETKPDGTRKVTWELSDWIGLAILMVVAWALISGISPIDIIKELKS